MGWWGGKADLFKLHINISRTSPPHFLSVLGGNELFQISLGVFEDKVRLNSIEVGKFYLNVEFWTLLQCLYAGQLSANNGIQGFYGREKHQCPYGLRW